LTGGTALSAFYLHHRVSEDLDFFTANPTKDNEIIKIDFALDSPFRFEMPHLDGKYGIYVDSLVGIACGKMSALYDRAEPKDFVDVYFIAKEIIPLILC